MLAAYELLRHAWPCLPAGDDGGGTAATASISQAKRDKLLKVLQVGENQNVNMQVKKCIRAGRKDLGDVGIVK